MVNESYVKLSESRGIESNQHKLFMRMSGKCIVSWQGRQQTTTLTLKYEKKMVKTNMLISIHHHRERGRRRDCKFNNF